MKGLYRLLLILIVFSIVFSLSAFGFYKFFSNKASPIISNLEIEFSDSGKVIKNDSVSESEMSIKPYKFLIKNKGNLDTKYKVILDDNGYINIRKKFQYKLFLNDVLIKSGRLNELENDILDSRSIKGEFTNRYELRVWLFEDVNDDQVYTYSLRVEPIL